MSFITPDSELKLYSNVDITDEKHMIFTTAQEREAFFASHLFRANVEFSYMNPGDPIYIEIEPQYINQFNYISFKNKSFENKIFYARVKHQPDYENNEVRYIAYEIDAFTTYMFDVTYEECEIDREHLSVAERATEDANVFNYDLAAEFTTEPFNFSDGVKAKRDECFPQYIPIMNTIPVPGSESDLDPCVVGIFSQTAMGETVESSWDEATHFPKASMIKSFEIKADGTIPSLDAELNGYAFRGTVSSILGLYYLPHKMAFERTSLSGFDHYDYTFRNQNFTNGKLCRFPYTYIRVTDPLGNKKEYQLEKFDVVAGRNDMVTVKFGIFYSLNGYPQVILAPYHYNGYKSEINPDNPDLIANYNFDEKMVFSEFPQLAYNTDGYLTWMGNTLRGQALKDTTAAPWSYNDWMNGAGVGMQFGSNILGGTVGGGAKGGAGGAIAGALTSFTGGALKGLDSLYNFQTLQKPMHEAGQDYMEGGDIQIPGFLADAKGVFAADEYHAGSGNVASLIAYQFNRVGFMIELVHPVQSVAEKYNSFLDRYGYNVSRIGVPRIAHYMGQGTPYERVNGIPVFNNNNQTFVKCMNANVKGPNMLACQAIERMLNKGHWFEKVVSNG